MKSGWLLAKLKNKTFFTFLFLLCTFIVILLVNFLENDGPSISTEPLDFYSPYSQGEFFGNTSVKTILVWNSFFSSEDYDFGFSEDAFREHGCEWNNCVLTNKRNIMPITKYNVIIFRVFDSTINKGFLKRSDDQLYAFFSMESPVNQDIPLRLRDFFNLTISYRLDADVSWTYFKVKDRSGKIIAPSINPSWLPYDGTNSSVIDHGLREKLKGKSKKVAWFVSNCKTHNDRFQYVRELQKYIEVDVYGYCGPFECPRSNKDACLKMLSEQYYFYLSFENSHCNDYVTEKLSKPLQCDAIPIVYGGVNYSRYVPPHSYIEANNMNPEKLANKLNYLISNNSLYKEYFWWRRHYTYIDSYMKNGLHPFCELCRLVNQPDLNPHLYEDIVGWWQGTEQNPQCYKPII